jgi:hypothetical protein
VEGVLGARNRDLNMEMIKQNHHERLRADFAKKAKDFMEWISTVKANMNVEGFASLGELQDKLAEIETKYEQREIGKQKLQVLEELNQLLIDDHITDLSAVTEHSMQVKYYIDVLMLLDTHC